MVSDTEISSNLPKVYKRPAIKGGRKDENLPGWIMDDEIRERVESVFEMYIQRVPIKEIARRTINPDTNRPISITQVWKDLRRAREVRAIMFRDKMNDILEEQVAARHNIVRELREQLSLMRTPYMEYSSESGRYEPVMSDSQIYWGDKEAKAAAEILKQIGEQEKAIEDLYGLRDSRPSLVNAQPGSSQSISIVQMSDIGGTSDVSIEPLDQSELPAVTVIALPEDDLDDGDLL